MGKVYEIQIPGAINEVLLEGSHTHSLNQARAWCDCLLAYEAGPAWGACLLKQIRIRPPKYATLASGLF